MKTLGKIPIQIKLLAFLIALLCISTISLSHAQTFKCSKVIDGGTILLSSGEKVHLIGVDTPETNRPQKPLHYYGKEACAFTKRMVEGKEVKLEYDWQRKDKYGRTLAYVYLADGTFLNAEIIKQGYGHAYTKFAFKYLEQFRQYEREAREAKRGLWADQPGKEEIKYIRELYVGSEKSNIYHLPHCTIAQKIKPIHIRTFNGVKEAVDAGYLPCKVCKPPYYK
jgi:micrococcal nuclease